MTRPVSRAGHSAVHGLAMRARCRCPDCGRGPRTATAFEEDLFDEEDDVYDEDDLDEDADYALRRAAAAVGRVARAAGARLRRAVTRPAAAARTGATRRVQRTTAAAARRAGATTRRGRTQNPRALTQAQRAALNQTVTAFGWTGFRPGSGGPANMQQLADFQRAGGVAQQGTRRRLALTSEGRRLLREDPRFRHLAPLFETRARGQQRIYEIAPAGQLDRPNYIGKTGRRPGERLLEHLQWGNDVAHRQLVAAQRDGTLSQLQVADGRFTISDRGRRSHLGEVALMELTNPAWNDPRRHGFDAETDAFDW